MKLQRWVVAAAASVAVAAGFGPASAAGAALGGIEQASVDAYAKHFRMPSDLARQHLDRQKRASGIVAAVQKIAAESFGGLSFDNETGRFWVGLTARSVDGGTAGRNVTAAPEGAAVREEFERRDLDSVVDVVLVEYSAADLEQAQERLTRSLAESDLKGEVRSGIDSRRNRVVVQVDPEAAESVSQMRAKLERMSPAAFSSDAVTVVAGKKGDFTARSTYCGQPDCTFPLRGGVRMYNPTIDRLCTTGYVGTVPDGRLVYITAGHCINALGGSWFSYLYPFNSPYSFGWRLDHRFGIIGDIGLIVLNASSVWATNGGFPPYISVWGYSDAYPMYGTAWSYQGMQSCWSGINSQGCMVVTAVAHTQYYNDVSMWIGNLTAGIYQWGCLQGGSSGGPVYAANWSYGVNSGSSGCSVAYYADIFHAYVLWGALAAHF